MTLRIYHFLNYLKNLLLQIIHSQQELFVEHRPEFPSSVCGIVHYLPGDIQNGFISDFPPSLITPDYCYDNHLIKLHGFYVNLLRSIERLESIVEIVLFYPRSTLWRRPYFYGIYRHGEIHNAIAQAEDDVRDQE